jgi:predicted phosphodiesterase
MTNQEILGLLAQVEERFDEEGNVIAIESGRVVFVGDTHGDIEATRKVTEKHLNSENKVVFLGDYVDRGSRSLENVNLLLSLKLEFPDNLYLLMGNHEGRAVTRFYPADFWDGLPAELGARYESVLSKLPLVVSASNGIIALHGALPDVEDWAGVERIHVGDGWWRQITWGDWQDRPGMVLGFGDLTGRPRFGQDWFNQKMGLLGKRVLIRSHQPGIDRVIFGSRCLTIFTTSAYSTQVSERVVALADLDNEIRSVGDLVIETV